MIVSLFFNLISSFTSEFTNENWVSLRVQVIIFLLLLFTHNNQISRGWRDFLGNQEQTSPTRLPPEFIGTQAKHTHTHTDGIPCAFKLLFFVHVQLFFKTFQNLKMKSEYINFLLGRVRIADSTVFRYSNYFLLCIN